MALKNSSRIPTTATNARRRLSRESDSSQVSECAGQSEKGLEHRHHHERGGEEDHDRGLDAQRGRRKQPEQQDAPAQARPYGE